MKKAARIRTKTGLIQARIEDFSGDEEALDNFSTEEEDESADRNSYRDTQLEDMYYFI